MLEHADNATRVLIMRSFLAQSGARSPAGAMMMLRREYPEASDDERRAAIASSQLIREGAVD